MSERVMIFDVDGTLVDSNDVHARAWVEALAQFGIHVETAAARRLIGMGSDKLLPTLAGIDAESPRGKEIDEAGASSSGDSTFLTCGLSPRPARCSWRCEPRGSG